MKEQTLPEDWEPGRPQYFWCRYDRLIGENDKVRVYKIMNKMIVTNVDYPHSESLVRLPDWLILINGLQSTVVAAVAEYPC